MSDTTVEVSISLTEQQSKDLQRFYETTEARGTVARRDRFFG